MEEFDGARRQVALHAGLVVEESEWAMTYPVRGVVVEGGVRFQDQSGLKRTVVDVLVYDRTQRALNTILYNVPLLYPKTNRDNGEEWTPEAGDFVLIGFVNANLRDPVVLGYLAAPNNTVQALAADAPRSYRKRSGTSEEIDKDGNRVTIIHGHETVTVETGDVTVSVVEGKVTVTVAGKTSWTSGGGIDLDGGPGSPKGVVQGDCICPLIKRPHIMRSETVKSSL